MSDSPFSLSAPYQPRGDQGDAIDRLTRSVLAGNRHQTLLGVTGSGKTFTAANVLRNLGRPALVMSHNKTLAAQLYSEFKQFFPDNAVEYFVSYFDYYQPEAYIPRSDTYIEKDSSINEEIERLRLSTTASLLSRSDVIVVASVSCIYGLGSPADYRAMLLRVEQGQALSREKLLGRLVDMLYERNDIAFGRGRFRVRGDVVEVQPGNLDDAAYRIEFFGDEVERLSMVDPLTGTVMRAMPAGISLYPAKQFVTPADKLRIALGSIRQELDERIAWFEREGKLLEAQRIKLRTEHDLEMLQEMGFCSGIENYTRHLTGRPAGARPNTLLDFFPEDFLLVVDESHATIPQIGGMYEGDRSRKQTLVDYGFRLPSAMDNRPLRFAEFMGYAQKNLYISATPADFELRNSVAGNRDWLPPMKAFKPRGYDEPEDPPAAVAGEPPAEVNRESLIVNRGGTMPPLPIANALLANRLASGGLDTPLPAKLRIKRPERPQDSTIPGGDEASRESSATIHDSPFTIHSPTPPAAPQNSVAAFDPSRPGTPLVVEQIIRPTGLLDPRIQLRPLAGQIDETINLCRERVDKGERILVTTLTKRTAEDLTDYLREVGLKVRYLHSDIDAIERVDILRDLRAGAFDILIGINLLREGLDLPEVSLVCILDADKEGYLRSQTSLIQTAGRAARHINGEVFLFADQVTGSMRRLIDVTEYRRAKQLAYNEANGITPQSVVRAVQASLHTILRAKEVEGSVVREDEGGFSAVELLRELEEDMIRAASNMEYERAAILRDQIAELKKGTGTDKISGPPVLANRRAVSYARPAGRARKRR